MSDAEMRINPVLGEVIGLDFWYMPGKTVVLVAVPDNVRIGRCKVEIHVAAAAVDDKESE